MSHDEQARSALVRYGDLCFKHRGLLLPVAGALLLIPSPPLFPSAVGTSLVGLVLALIGETIRVGTIGLVYIIRGGKDHKVYAEELVTEGLYSHCRNPMYLGNAFLLGGLAVASNSVVFAIAGVPTALAVHVGIITAEEHFLRSKFGQKYDAYCARVPRLVPKLAAIKQTLRGSRFNWPRVLDKEFSGPLDWLAATTIIALVALWRADDVPANSALVTVLLAVLGVRLLLWGMSRVARRRATLSRGPVA